MWKSSPCFHPLSLHLKPPPAEQTVPPCCHNSNLPSSPGTDLYPRHGRKAYKVTQFSINKVNSPRNMSKLGGGDADFLQTAIMIIQHRKQPERRNCRKSRSRRAQSVEAHSPRLNITVNPRSHSPERYRSGGGFGEGGGMDDPPRLFPLAIFCSFGVGNFLSRKSSFPLLDCADLLL